MDMTVNYDEANGTVAVSWFLALSFLSHQISGELQKMGYKRADANFMPSEFSTEFNQHISDALYNLMHVVPNKVQLQRDTDGKVFTLIHVINPV